jgi:hypothetical protein
LFSDGDDPLGGDYHLDTQHPQSTGPLTNREMSWRSRER